MGLFQWLAPGAARVTRLCLTDTAISMARVTTWTYSALGLPVTQSSPGGAMSHAYAYYSNTSFTGTSPNEVGHTTGDLQSITNAAGHVTQLTLYDKTGRVKQMVDPKGVVTDTVYTPGGWVSSVTITPPGGTARTTTYTYDNAGQLTGVAMPDATTMSYTYDAAGQLTGVSLPDSTTLGYSYDAAHRLVGVTDVKGNAVSYTLDAMGNRVSEQVKDPLGNLQRSITRVYDALNRVQQTTGESN